MWIGQDVLVEFWAGPEAKDEELDQLFSDPDKAAFVKGQTVRQVLTFVAYDSFGVVLRLRREHEPRFFVPWAAVLRIEGFDPEAKRPEHGSGVAGRPGFNKFST